MHSGAYARYDCASGKKCDDVFAVANAATKLHFAYVLCVVPRRSANPRTDPSAPSFPVEAWRFHEASQGARPNAAKMTREGMPDGVLRQIRLHACNFWLPRCHADQRRF